MSCEHRIEVKREQGAGTEAVGHAGRVRSSRKELGVFFGVIKNRCIAIIYSLLPTPYSLLPTP
ncbi:hypothetical protein [Moorena producens]|uniref:hypothetical protein n=1 Tax=Moorena producens TaxID=1155739 RepID=UPI003C70EA10